MDVSVILAVVLVVAGWWLVRRARVKKHKMESFCVQEWHHKGRVRDRYATKLENSGFVYFVHESGHQYIKIGKAKDTSKRIQNDFGTTMPYTFTLLHTIESLNHHKTEQLFHQHFRRKRKSGEWFQLSERDMEWVKKGEFPREIADSIKGY